MEKGAGIHEEEQILSGAGDVCPEAGGIRYSRTRSMPQDGNQRTDFLPLEKKYIGMGVAEVRRLRVLEEENRKLKQLVADLSLDKQMLQDVLQKKP